MKITSLFKREPSVPELLARIEAERARLATLRANRDELSLASLTDESAAVEVSKLSEAEAGIVAGLNVLEAAFAKLKDKQQRKSDAEAVAAAIAKQKRLAALQGRIAGHAAAFDEGLAKAAEELKAIRSAIEEGGKLDASWSNGNSRRLLPAALARTVRYFFGGQLATEFFSAKHCGPLAATFASKQMEQFEDVG